MHDAAQECNVLAVSYLIECGADVNIADKVYRKIATTLSPSDILTSTRVVDLLVLQDGWTPLYIAAQNGHVAVVKALIKLGGAKVDIVDHVRSSSSS